MQCQWMPHVSERIVIWRSLMRVGFGQALAYRGQVAIFLLTALFPLVMMTVWLSVVEEVGPTAGWDRQGFISYYAVGAVVFQLTTSSIAWRWDDLVRTGELSSLLLRPVSPLTQQVGLEVGQRVLSAALLVPVLVVATIALPDLNVSGSVMNLILGVVALGGGYALTTAMALTFAMVAFWSTQSGNLYALWWGAGAFLAGWIAPVSVLPPGLRRAAALLPFRSTVGLPIELILGRLDTAQIVVGMATLAGWLAAFTVAVRVLWSRGIKRHQAVGG